MKIQVLYPIYELTEDAKERFYLSISSLLNQEEYRDIEICISDGSKEGQKLKRPRGKYKYYHEYIGEKFNRNKIINNGVKELIDQDIFIISDIDIIFSSSFIKDILNEYENHEESIVFPTLFLKDKKNKKYFENDIYNKNFDEIFEKIINYYHYYAEKLIDKIQDNKEFHLEWSSSLLKTEQFYKINGFDENFSGYSPDVEDFFLRLRLFDDLIIAKNFFCYHLSHESNFDNKQKFLDLFWGFLYFQKKKNEYIIDREKLIC